MLYVLIFVPHVDYSSAAYCARWVQFVWYRKELALAKVLAKHDQVDGLWYHGSATGSREVEASSNGNLKRTWVNGGHACDWFSAAAGEGRTFLAEATQVKTIWLPYGD